MPLDSSGNYLNKFKGNTKVFIETGTYIGDGVQSALNAKFNAVYSIELSKKHYEVSRNRFLDNSSVNLFLGSSEIELPKVLDDVNEPFLLWLDAHWSDGDTVGEPMHVYLLKELESILPYSSKFEDSVIMIDDMIYYINNPDFSLGFVEEVEKLVNKIKPNGKIEYFYPQGTPNIILVSK